MLRNEETEGRSNNKTTTNDTLIQINKPSRCLYCAFMKEKEVWSEGNERK